MKYLFKRIFHVNFIIPAALNEKFEEGAAWFNESMERNPKNRGKDVSELAQHDFEQRYMELRLEWAPFEIENDGEIEVESMITINGKKV